MEFAPCFEAALRQSEANLARYRAALTASLQARRSLLGAHSMSHFQTTEKQWDVYSTSQLEAAADLADTPVLVVEARGEARIKLILDHMRTLDRIYYTLMHNDCGACLTDC